MEIAPSQTPSAEDLIQRVVQHVGGAAAKSPDAALAKSVSNAAANSTAHFEEGAAHSRAAVEQAKAQAGQLAGKLAQAKAGVKARCQPGKKREKPAEPVAPQPDLGLGPRLRKQLLERFAPRRPAMDPATAETLQAWQDW